MAVCSVVAYTATFQMLTELYDLNSALLATTILKNTQNVSSKRIT